MKGIISTFLFIVIGSASASADPVISLSRSGSLAGLKLEYIPGERPEGYGPDDRREVYEFSKNTFMYKDQEVVCNGKYDLRSKVASMGNAGRGKIFAHLDEVVCDKKIEGYFVTGWLLLPQNITIGQEFGMSFGILRAKVGDKIEKVYSGDYVGDYKITRTEK